MSDRKAFQAEETAGTKTLRWDPCLIMLENFNSLPPCHFPSQNRQAQVLTTQALQKVSHISPHAPAASLFNLECLFGSHVSLGGE